MLKFKGSMLCLLAVLFFPLSSYAKEEGKPEIKIRWAITHLPENIFLETANRIDLELNKLTNGKLRLDIIIPKEITPNSGSNSIVALDNIERGKVDMGQVGLPVLALRKNVLSALLYPSNIKSHDHFSAIVDGKIGDDLLSDLNNPKIKGLAFTYSGGRIFVATTFPINGIDDFKGKKISGPASSLYEDVAKQMGMKIEESWPLLAENDLLKYGLDAVEGTFSDFRGLYTSNPGRKFTHYVETIPHVYSTVLLVNKEFFEKLPVKYQSALLQAAKKAAKDERLAVEKTERETIKWMNEVGIKRVHLSRADKQKLDVIVAEVLKKYESKEVVELTKKINTIGSGFIRKF